MFTASLPPAVIAGVSHAFDQVERQPALRARLGRNAARLHQGLSASGFALGPTVSPIVSIRLADPQTAVVFWNRLLDAGVYTNLALPPATPESKSLLRTSVSAVHSHAQIDRAIDAITSIGIELGVVSSERLVMYPAAE